jgi:hypothetical protein
LLVIPSQHNHLQPLPTFSLAAFTIAATSIDKDTLSYWEATKQTDKSDFVAAMDKEVDAHTTCKHWELLSCLSTDPKHMPLQAVWVMKRKLIPGTGMISKYKARLNAT